MMSDRLYTARQLAEILQVNPQTIYRWANDGVIEDFKIGKVRRFLMPEGKDKTNGKENTGREDS